MLIDWFTMQEDANRVWFTADQHFGHANIIKFCERPYDYVEQMDDALIAKWNAVVGPEDVVFHLGDFTLGGTEVAERYFGQVQGRIGILANEWHHDKRWIDQHLYQYYPPRGIQVESGVVKSASGYGVELLPPMVVFEMPWHKDGKHPLAITLCHYPLAEWDRKHYGAWHLHGHSHGKHQHNYKPDELAFILDVGVDAMGGFPINLGGVLEMMYGMGWV